MKATYTKEQQGWCIKIYCDKFDKRSVQRMHKLLDQAVDDVKECKEVAKLVKPYLDLFEDR